MQLSCVLDGGKGLLIVNRFPDLPEGNRNCELGMVVAMLTKRHISLTYYFVPRGSCANLTAGIIRLESLVEWTMTLCPAD
jgi:hypothetical protein